MEKYEAFKNYKKYNGYLAYSVFFLLVGIVGVLASSVVLVLNFSTTPSVILFAFMFCIYISARLIGRYSRLSSECEKYFSVPKEDKKEQKEE